MSNIPDDLLDLIEELVIIEEEKNRRKKEREDYGERLYEELPLPSEKKEDKPFKIEISLE